MESWLEIYLEYLNENEAEARLGGSAGETIVSEIDNIIRYLNNIYGSNIQFNPNTSMWQDNNFMTYQYFVTILNSLEEVKKEYYNFTGWKDLKKYIDYDSIDYKELIDIIENIITISDVISTGEIRNHNIWNYIYLLNWNENSTIEWE